RRSTSTKLANAVSVKLLARMKPTRSGMGAPSTCSYAPPSEGYAFLDFMECARPAASWQADDGERRRWRATLAPEGVSLHVARIGRRPQHPPAAGCCTQPAERPLRDSLDLVPARFETLHHVRCEALLDGQRRRLRLAREER